MLGAAGCIGVPILIVIAISVCASGLKNIKPQSLKLNVHGVLTCLFGFLLSFWAFGIARFAFSNVGDARSTGITWTVLIAAVSIVVIGIGGCLIAKGVVLKRLTHDVDNWIDARQHE